MVLSGYSVVRLSRVVWDDEVAGSNPATPTFFFSVFSTRFEYVKRKDSKITNIGDVMIEVVIAAYAITIVGGILLLAAGVQ